MYALGPEILVRVLYSSHVRNEFIFTKTVRFSVFQTKFLHFLYSGTLYVHAWQQKI